MTDGFEAVIVWVYHSPSYKNVNIKNVFNGNVIKQVLKHKWNNIGKYSVFTNGFLNINISNKYHVVIVKVK